MSGWAKYRLGDLSVDVSYGYTESASDQPIGPKFLRITDIRDGEINWETVPYCPINERDYLKNKLEIGDIVVARTGATTGITQIIKHNVDAVFASYLIRFRIDKMIANPFFVGFVLKSTIWNDYVGSIVGGSAQPGANAKQFSDFSFNLPNLATQNAIAEILSSVDDKIELNNKINQELENLAQTLFKQWFIDFEFPNENGEPYKSSGGEMVDSELGEIPKGWEVGRFGDFTKITSGGTPSRNKNEYYADGDILWVKSKELNNSMFFDTEEKINELGLKNSSAKLLPAYSVLIAMYGATVGQFGLITTEATCNQAICAVLPSERLPFSYNYLFFQKYRKEFENYATGSAQQNISQELIKSIIIAVPESHLLHQFHSLVLPLLRAIEINCKENRKLTNLRDTLLTKLISGDLQVNNGNFDESILLQEQIKINLKKVGIEI